MTRANRCPICLLALVILAAGCALLQSQAQAGQASPASAQTYTRWENALQSSKAYKDSCRDVTLRVTYTGPEKQEIKAYGYWDGGKTFRFCCAFPTAGTWQWKTECSDTSNKGLHGKTGKVDVTKYEGDNPLYKRGLLRVSDNKRYLTFADGTPFLWVGDTAWAGAMKSTASDWAEYLSDRATKRFTITQIGPDAKWAKITYQKGKEPFLGKGVGCPNPAFWRQYAERVQAANDKGIYVLMVGLMEPYRRYPETEEACSFARQMVARMFGNFVIFSPSFDSNYVPIADEVGAVVREATTVHLVTQHPGTPTGQPTQTFSEIFYDKPYLDFSGVQTGHNYGNRDRCASQAINWNLHLYKREPHKPIVNLEAYYDGGDKKGGTAKDARSLGWLTMLSGAVGYTYGTGVYHWDTDPASEVYWKKCMAQPSSNEMTALHDFFTSIDWWKLEPVHDLIRNQPKEPTKKMVVAATAKRDLAVAYMPDNNEIEIDLTSFPQNLRGRWLDPVKNQYYEIESGVTGGSVQSLVPPDSGDWVLLLTVPPQVDVPTGRSS